jgi:2-polyprenyl-3-methyl-5-hydroxy-6-metoxy-1,4-benzoquinol methylase
MRRRPQERCPNCASAGRNVYRDLRDKVYGAPDAWDMSRCANEACGVYWLDPEPLPDDLGIAYRDYHTHDAPGAVADPRSTAGAAYVERTLGIPSQAGLRNRLKSRLLDLFPSHGHAALYAHFYLRPHPGGRLLEVGCGAGEHLATMARDGWSVRGIDFDPDAVAAARSRGLDVMLGDLRDQTLAAGSFDAVVMAQVIEHVYDPPGLFGECARLLAPGGRLVCITPNADALGHRIYGRDWRGLEPPRHLAIYTARALRLACARAGLAVVRLIATTRDASNMFLTSERIAKIGDRSLIERPRAGSRAPLRLRALAAVETAGSACGLGWGEELVLTATRPSDPA